MASSAGGLKSISVFLLELSPSPRASAFTLSDRGGSRFGVGAVGGLEGVEAAGVCEFEGAGAEAGSAGLEFCAHTAAPNTSQPTKSKMRINIILPLPVGRAECLQALARGLKLGKPASLLFDQVVADAAHTLSRLEDTPPVGNPFSE